MHFIVYAVRYVLEAGLSFGILFTISAAVVWWDGRHLRRERAYENGRT